MLMTLILPFVCTLIPLFVMYKRFGWIGSYLPLEVPTFFGSSVFSTFLLRQFFMTIPQSLSEAARIDGANEFYIYSRIILPLAKPAMATVILFQFIYCWNDYLGPLVYISNQNSYPLSLGLALILGRLHDELGMGDGRSHGGDRPDRHLVLPDPAHVHPGDRPDRHEGMRPDVREFAEPVSGGRTEGASRHLAGMFGARIMAALATMFNFLALNLVLLIASLPVVTLPAGDQRRDGRTGPMA